MLLRRAKRSHSVASIEGSESGEGRLEGKTLSPRARFAHAVTPSETLDAQAALDLVQVPVCGSRVERLITVDTGYPGVDDSLVRRSIKRMAQG